MCTPMSKVETHLAEADPQDCGLRYEPPAPAAEAPTAGTPVAAALLVGGAHVHIQPGDPRLVGPSLMAFVAYVDRFCAWW